MIHRIRVKMINKCLECGKEIPESSESAFCEKCDEKLDKQFDDIEDNILIYKELLDNEIKVLEKFEDEDIRDLFKRVYAKLFREEGVLKKESIAVLNKLKSSFGLKESELGIEKIPDIKEFKKAKPKDECPQCNKKIEEGFNLCPYCGCKLRYFSPIEKSYEEYRETDELKERLIKKYEGKKLEDVIKGYKLYNESGSYYLIEDKTFLKCEILDPIKAKSKILSDLKLIDGIDIITEQTLKEQGYRTIEDLVEHYRFGGRARSLLNIIDNYDYYNLIKCIEYKFPKSHPLALFSSSFFGKDNFIILDIETLGLFNRPIILIGIARIIDDYIVIKQFLTCDITEEKAILSEFLSNISQNIAFITFNGRTFDIPYIQERLSYYGMHGDLNKPNYDILYFSRRAWREMVDNCKLHTLEKFLFNIKRQDDIPSALIPNFYETYIRNGNVGLLLPIIDHNKQDIITLASLFSKLHDEWKND